MELLVECGADVNAVDNENNTALHLCSEALQNVEIKQYHDLMKRIVVFLLKNGAHIDMVNLSGYSASKDLTSSVIELNIQDLVNLKCLAARVVMKYKIPYVEHIPESLKSFAQMHGTPTVDSVSDAVLS